MGEPRWGIHFTGENYPLEKFAERLKRFLREYGVQVYLEPGEASITKSTTLEVTVLDKLYNGKNLVVVDSSIEAHLLDLLIYRENAKVIPTRGHIVTWSAASPAWPAIFLASSISRTS